MAYAGKTSNNNTSQLESVAWSPKKDTVTPTIGGLSNGLTGPDLAKRTSSPAAQNEKIMENVPGGPTRA